MNRPVTAVLPSTRPAHAVRPAVTWLLVTTLTTLFGTVLCGAAVPTAARAATSGSATSGSASSVGTQRWIVRLDDHALPVVREAVSAAGGRVLADAAALHLVVVEVDGATAAALRGLPGVAGVAADRSVRMTSLGFDPASSAGAMTNVTRLTGANELWKRGHTGAGVDIALIDTGVAPVVGLTSSAKIVVGPDLSFESQDPDLRYLDSYGHGTHMAGIMAGRERSKTSGWLYAADRGTFYGMAPDARVLSVKLADHYGAVDASQVIAAVNWVVQHRTDDGMNIRILNLSFGTESPQSPQLDPLSWAAEAAWRAGLVVVASAGNDGGTVDGLSNPAYNPWVVAVGASDTNGTDTVTDDTVPSFSARAASRWGLRSVDVVAPGVGIVAPGVPGSFLDTVYPGARVGNGFMRGSGTSQSAAVVSGGVALLLQQRPWLDPDDVKWLLMNTAKPLTDVASTAQGRGSVNFFAAGHKAPWHTEQLWPTGDGVGSLEAARGGFHVAMDGVELRGETDIMGGGWDGDRFAWETRTETSWTWDGAFNGNYWTGQSFVDDATGWAGRTWSGRTWSGRTWSGSTWSGRTWSGRTWSTAAWDGSGWSSALWVTPVVPTTWSGRLWSTSRWG